MINNEEYSGDNSPLFDEISGDTMRIAFGDDCLNSLKARKQAKRNAAKMIKEVATDK